MKELKEGIYYIIYKYSKELKMADEAFVKEVLNLCINTFKIEDYVLDYVINTSRNNKENAGYDISQKRVYINMDNIIRSSLEQITEGIKHGVNFNEFEFYYITNSNFIYAIVHELTHALQYKECIENEKNPESKILKVSLERNLALLKNDRLSLQEVMYFKELDKQFANELYYRACPSERMADIRGLEFERDIVKLMDDEMKKNLEPYTEFKLLNSQISGYSNIGSPTTFVTYVNEVLKRKYNAQHRSYEIEEIEEIYKSMCRRYNLPFDERILLGLPISEYEKQKVYCLHQKYKNTIIK